MSLEGHLRGSRRGWPLFGGKVRTKDHVPKRFTNHDAPVAHLGSIRPQRRSGFNRTVYSLARVVQVTREQ